MDKILQKIMNKENLSEKETSYVIEGIISGEITDTQAGAFLTSLATKGETEDEIFGIVETMRRHMKTLDQ